MLEAKCRLSDKVHLGAYTQNDATLIEPTISGVPHDCLLHTGAEVNDRITILTIIHKNTCSEQWTTDCVNQQKMRVPQPTLAPIHSN